MDEQPHVSVVIPTRNRWDLLARRGLRAALAQEGVTIEVVVVDDGSDARAPDRSPFDDSRVTVIRHDSNLGVAAARNTGIRAAAGDWIAFLDDDDLWAPSKLATVVEAAQRTDADFGFSSVIVVDKGLAPLTVMPAPPSVGLENALRERNVVCAGASNVVARTSLLVGSGAFDESLATAADWELWLRLARHGRAASVDEPLVAYRASTWIIEDEPRHRRDYQRMAAKHPEMSIDWLGHERWIADSYLWHGHWALGARKHVEAWLRHGDLRSLTKAGRALVSGRRRARARLARLPRNSDWFELYS